MITTDDKIKQKINQSLLDYIPLTCHGLRGWLKWADQLLLVEYDYELVQGWLTYHIIKTYEVHNG